MKRRFTLLLCMICLLHASYLMALCGGSSFSCIPVKSGNAPFHYGGDVLINDQATQDQRNVNITVVYNGWLFAVYSYATASTYGVTTVKSTDDGHTWTVFSTYDFGNSAE